MSVGSVAGSKRKDGYSLIQINRVKYLFHRLVFLYMTGEFPEEEVDHIDGEPSNNSWVNLRAASHSENLHNCRTRIKRKHNLPSNIYPMGKKFMVCFSNKYFGVWKTVEEALIVRDEIKIGLGFHPNHGVNNNGKAMWKL